MAEMTKQEREGALAALKRLYEAARREYDQKAVRYEALGRELTTLSESMRSYKGSIASVERELGLLAQIRLPEAAEVKVGKPKPVDVTQVAMRIVAAKHESGGITFDEVFRTLHEQGHEITREYLHTILNRKKNYQKKLDKVEDKWFLTDKGKQELEIE